IARLPERFLRGALAEVPPTLPGRAPLALKRADGLTQASKADRNEGQATAPQQLNAADLLFREGHVGIGQSPVAVPNDKARPVKPLVPGDR
ncbi:MAG: hypothetical protein M3R02_02365, partial [Chloroflexota bacterium]|nr:hypothetical protein [Chloroflexota bacterium]